MQNENQAIDIRQDSITSVELVMQSLRETVAKLTESEKLFLMQNSVGYRNLWHELTPVTDKEPITHEWLITLGFALSAYKTTEGYGWFDLGILDYYYVPPNYTNIVIRIRNHPLKHITTRGQLRRLIDMINGNQA